MIMNLLILLILATLVSFVDTTVMVLTSSQLPDSNCCVDVAEILAKFHQQFESGDCELVNTITVVSTNEIKVARTRQINRFIIMSSKW